MGRKSINELRKKVETFSNELTAIENRKFSGYDVVVEAWARLIRSSLPVFTETIEVIDRGSKAVVCATIGLVLATVVLASTTIALVFVTKTDKTMPTAQQQPVKIIEQESKMEKALKGASNAHALDSAQKPSK